MKTFQGSILKRALGEKEFKSLVDQYIDARQKSRGNTPPSASHVRLAALGKKHGASLAGRKAGTSAACVDYAMSRVARYEWLNKN